MNVVTRYPRSACPTRSTACSGFTLEWIIAGKWSPDGALLGSNGNLWIKWSNAAEAHSAWDLYLIWFWRRVEGPQSSDSSFLAGRLHLFSVSWTMHRKASIILIGNKTVYFSEASHDSVLWHWVDTDLHSVVESIKSTACHNVKPHIYPVKGPKPQMFFCWWPAHIGGNHIPFFGCSIH